MIISLISMASETVVYYPYNILQQVFVIRHLFLAYRGLSRPASVLSMMMMMMMYVTLLSAPGQHCRALEPRNTNLYGIENLYCTVIDVDLQTASPRDNFLEQSYLWKYLWLVFVVVFYYTEIYYIIY